jgi:hypothetical protein
MCGKDKETKNTTKYEPSNEFVSFMVDYAKEIIIGQENGLYHIADMGKQMHILKDKFQMGPIVLSTTTSYFNDVYKSLIKKDDEDFLEKFAKIKKLDSTHSDICILNIMFHVTLASHLEVNREKIDMSSYEKFMYSIAEQLYYIFRNKYGFMKSKFDHVCTEIGIEACDPDDDLFKVYRDPAAKIESDSESDSDGLVIACDENLTETNEEDLKKLVASLNISSSSRSSLRSRKDSNKTTHDTSEPKKVYANKPTISVVVVEPDRRLYDKTGAKRKTITNVNKTETNTCTSINTESNLLTHDVSTQPITKRKPRNVAKTITDETVKEETKKPIKRKLKKEQSDETVEDKKITVKAKQSDETVEDKKITVKAKQPRKPRTKSVTNQN